MDKKRFLTKNFEGTNFHPLLSEYMEMAAWEAECKFSDNFRGLIAYFLEDGVKDAYGIDYYWIDNGKKEIEESPLGTKVHHLTKENHLRGMLYDYSYQIADSVRACGGGRSGTQIDKTRL